MASMNATSCPPHLIALSLTHVLHDPSDPYSILSAYAALAPFFIFAAYVFIFAARRETIALTLILGQLGCEAVNYALKKWIREERPNGGGCYGKGYGMPSSHAQFMAFFAVFSSLYLLHRIRLRSNARKYLIAGAINVGSFTVCHSRVYLEYHTTRQVVVGALVGMVLAVGYYIVVEFVARPAGWMDAFLESDIAAYCMIKDSVGETNIVEIEYEAWRSRRQERSRRREAADVSAARDNRKTM